MHQQCIKMKQQKNPKSSGCINFELYYNDKISNMCKAKTHFNIQCTKWSHTTHKYQPIKFRISYVGWDIWFEMGRRQATLLQLMMEKWNFSSKMLWIIMKRNRAFWLFWVIKLMAGVLIWPVLLQHRYSIIINIIYLHIIIVVRICTIIINISNQT